MSTYLNAARAALLTVAVSATAAWAQGQAPDFRYGASRVIPGQYIVMFKPTTNSPAALAQQLAQQHGGQLLFTYTSAIKGFAARLPQQAVEALRANPNVQLVEPDSTVSLNATTTQGSATWGLDRIDQRDLPLSGSYTYNYDGAGVTAYIIDTGILTTHDDFGGRASGGYTAISDANGTTDCNGHGTHVAGTVGGSTYGVAKGVKLVAVRVLDCSGSGTTSGVIAGVDWVKTSAAKPAVANMSLGGGASSTLDTAVTNLVNSGVTLAVAAGNSNIDACTTSPARASGVITVGATTNTDARASYSNYGSCLEVFAPGSSITSAWYTSTTATNTISGTSMATPHVTGVAALLAQVYPSATPATILQKIIDTSTPNKVTSAGTGSPNRLLYSLDTSVAPPTTSTAVDLFALTTSTARPNSTTWTALVTVTVGSSASTPTPNATVTATFSYNTASASPSCTTNASGVCTLSVNASYKSIPYLNYKITNVTGAGIVYNATLTATPADSGRINRP